jgi:WhiB family transcriptional regulator, redox-sensing transcriptional regulator
MQQGDWGGRYATVRPANLPAPLLDEWTWQLLLRAREERAKRICRECPVIDNCREYAPPAPEAYGIWGALTPSERARFLAAPRP